MYCCEQFRPILMKMLLLVGAILTTGKLSTEVAFAQDWKMQPLPVPTRWAESVTPTNPLPEYPRPQMVREDWNSLNGLWQSSITAKDSGMPAAYDGSILVPFPLESALSGVGKQLKPDQLLWYRRTFALKPAERTGRVLLHFGAVDYKATVYLNGREVGMHEGGYESFTFDITDTLSSGTNEVVVKVYDPTDRGPNPHGKQALDPRGIFYTSTSGIWQTVWLESVPETYINGLIMTPDVGQAELRLHVVVNGQESGCTIQAIAKSGETVVARKIIKGETSLHISHPHLWSPDDPFLYDLEVHVLRKGRVVDGVKSYFGLRKIEVKKDFTGKQRIFLNDRYTYNLGVLDQGFWPDGIYTAPSDAALRFDIQAVKAMGFNTIRKHIKIEPDRWYYYCDKLGMLVWQDMVPPGDSTPEARTEFEKEVKESISQLYNHPSITTWVLFNETFGDPYDQARLSYWVKQLDSSRLLDGQSGPFDEWQIAEWQRHLDPPTLFKFFNGEYENGFMEKVQSMETAEPAAWASDMTDLHHYPDPRIPDIRLGRARVLGEYGGVGLPLDGHTWGEFGGFGYIEVTPKQMASTYSEMTEKLKVLEADGLTGSVYTQVFDVGGELNGLMTYDRNVTKIDVDKIRRINAKLVSATKNSDPGTHNFSAADADQTPNSRLYEKVLAEYRNGKRDMPFLRRIAIMAVAQKDQDVATEAGNAWIHGFPQPYSKDTWEFIYRVTRSSKDAGFKILLRQIATADEILGKNAAETKLREIINREEIAPRVADVDKTPLWRELQTKVTSKYGALGTEEVYGRAMINALKTKDWEEFGKYYRLYFETAALRSEYAIDIVSYVLFEHIVDPQILDAGINAVKRHMDSRKRDPVADRAIETDTYANLLYKAGRTGEAIEWEEKAMLLSEGHDKEITAHLNAMKAGLPTWPGRSS